MFDDTWPELDQRLERHSCECVGGSEGRRTQIPTNIKLTQRVGEGCSHVTKTTTARHIFFILTEM